MVKLTQPEDRRSVDRMHRRQLNRCYGMIVVGFIVAMLGYIQLLAQDASATTAVPVGIALFGFLIATGGFQRFGRLQRQRFMKGVPYSLREDFRGSSNEDRAASIYTPSRN